MLLLLRLVLPVTAAVTVGVTMGVLLPDTSAGALVGIACAFVIGCAFGELGHRAADWYLRRPPKQPRG